MSNQRFAVWALGVCSALGALTACHRENGAPSQPSLALTCSVTPSSGFAPLPVAIQVSAPGERSYAVNVSWGDGFAGLDTAHVYLQPGNYTVTANASRPGESASCTQTVSVQQAPPRPASRVPVFAAKISPSPATGRAPLTVNLNACDTVDPDGDRLIFTFDFGDGRRLDSTFCRREHVYSRTGRFSASVCATDGEPGHDACAAFEVNVTGAP
jgi:PKD repeat protein